MKVKRTFFNSRTDRLYCNYNDTNNYLFIILFDSGATLSLVLRDLKKNETVKNYIYSKILQRFDNVAEVDISSISLYEYNLLKSLKTPSVMKIC